MTSCFKIGLSCWIIQDGNYPDFKRGESAAFAVEFSPASPLSQTQIQGRPVTSIQSVGGCHHTILGEVVHVREVEWWAIDVGILMYQNQKPPQGIEVGCWVRGEVCLGVDPFFYLERLSRHHTAPALIYDWRIAKIEIQTAPFIATLQGNGGYFERDPEKLGWREIAQTDAWHDDEGRAEYLLHCELLESSPRR